MSKKKPLIVIKSFQESSPKKKIYVSRDLQDSDSLEGLVQSRLGNKSPLVILNFFKFLGYDNITQSLIFINFRTSELILLET